MENPSELVRELSDGSYKILGRQTRSGWHQPATRVPSVQWSPRTGVTRYEWARRHTPKFQQVFFSSLAQRYREKPPRPITLEDAFQSAQVTLPNGARGIDVATLDRVRESAIVDAAEHWRFTIMTQHGENGSVWDYLLVSNSDFVTLPDWELILRYRSWILDDSRTAVILMPPTGPDELDSYKNDRPNCIQIVSERIVPNGPAAT